MKITGIDEEKCIKCLECVKECPSHLFHKPHTDAGEKRRVFFEDPFDACIECGHCVAVCPTDAVEYESGSEAIEFEGIKDPATLIDYEKLIKVLQSRRSVRRFKKKPVPQEEIQAVLDAIRHAPSARNARLWKFLVLTDPHEIEDLKQRVVKMMGLLLKLVKIGKYIKFLLPGSIKELVEDPSTEPNLKDLMERVEKGEDPVFYDAPAVIITYCQTTGSARMTGNDGGIALTYGMLAAQSRGLGTCWIGYAQEALNRFKKNKKRFEIPKKMDVNGVFILGYPAVKYHRVPPRADLDVEWK